MDTISAVLFGVGIGMWIGRVFTRMACEREMKLIIRCEKASAKSGALVDEQVSS